jgi:catechol 2,3-dioxygenase-like lactoylglutathione lyase family enzyme
MSVELNHTIVWATDREVSAEFLAGVLGLPAGPVTGPFRQLPVANGVTLDFATAEGGVHGQHYAFLVSDREFDAAMARLRESGTRFWADPFHRAPGEINHESGGRGVYFADPDGHNMELLTRACGD